MTYVCPKCESERVYVKPNGRRMGVYCADCNTWIAWTTYRNALKLYGEIEEQNLNDDISIRRITKRKGNTKMTCSKCGCLLYNSDFPKVLGQFNLVNAKFCPDCGRELI